MGGNDEFYDTISSHKHQIRHNYFLTEEYNPNLLPSAIISGTRKFDRSPASTSNQPSTQETWSLSRGPHNDDTNQSCHHKEGDFIVVRRHCSVVYTYVAASEDLSYITPNDDPSLFSVSSSIPSHCPFSFASPRAAPTRAPLSPFRPFFFSLGCRRR